MDECTHVSPCYALPHCNGNYSKSNYVAGNVAQSGGLAFVTGDQESFIIRTDNTTFLNPSGPGRNSVRIQSNNQYNTHVAV
jgi:hypothetical protein